MNREPQRQPSHESVCEIACAHWSRRTSGPGFGELVVECPGQRRDRDHGPTDIGRAGHAGGRGRDPVVRHDHASRLAQLVVKNPAGYETASAVSIPDIRMHVDWHSLLTDTVIVEEVLIVAPAITFEWSLKGSNLGAIHENVKRNTRSGSDDNGGGKGEKHKEGQEFDKTVHIKKVTVKDAVINVSFIGGQDEVTQVSLPDLELRDIGNPSEGTTFSQASAAIFDAIYEAIDKAVMKPGVLLPQGVEQLGKSIGKMGKELLKELFGE